MEEPPSRQSFEILLITMEPRGIGVSAIRLTINYIQCQESRGGTAFSPKIYSISSKTEWVEEMHMPKRPVHLTKPGSIRVKIVFFFQTTPGHQLLLYCRTKEISTQRLLFILSAIIWDRKGSSTLDTVSEPCT